MSKKTLLTRPLAALMALILTLTLAPVALAETVMCPYHPGQASVHHCQKGQLP